MASALEHHDGIKKCIAENGEAVIYVIDATNLVQESMSRIGAWPPATVHLGQAMMAALLLQSLSEKEGDQKISLQWNTDGPFGHLYVEARNYGEVRGTITNACPPSVQDFTTKLGDGILQIRKTKGSSITSVVNSVGDVSLDIVEYLEKSEQRHCGINFSIKVDWKDESQKEFQVSHALGYLIDILPQATEQKQKDALLRWDRQMHSLGGISRWVMHPAQALDEMLQIITCEPKPKVIMSQRVLFSCHCTEDRANRAVTLSHKEEKHTEPVEVRCEYCGKLYIIKP